VISGLSRYEGVRGQRPFPLAELVGGPFSLTELIGGNTTRATIGSAQTNQWLRPRVEQRHIKRGGPASPLANAQL